MCDLSIYDGLTASESVKLMNSIARPEIERMIREGILNPDGLYPGSDCQWCEQYTHRREPSYGRFCQGEPIERNIYLSPCPCPEKRKLVLKGRIKDYQSKLVGIA